MAIKHYRDLVAWQEAMRLVKLVYRLTMNWPREEQYGLTSQLRRAAVSVPSNIAEGYGRRATQGFIRFLNIAHGSLMEVETQLQIGFELQFLKAEHLEKACRQLRNPARSSSALSSQLIAKHRAGSAH